MKYFVGFSLILLAFAGGLLVGLRLGSSPPAGNQTVQGFPGDVSTLAEGPKEERTSPEAHNPDASAKIAAQSTEREDLSHPPDHPELSGIPSHEMRGGRVPLEAADVEDLIREEDLKASLMESGIPEDDLERMFEGRRRALNLEDSGPGVEERSDEGMNLEELQKDFESSLKESGATPEEIEIMKEGFFRAIAPRPSLNTPRRGISRD